MFSKEEKPVVSDQRKVTSNSDKVIWDKLNETSNEQTVTSNE